MSCFKKEKILGNVQRFRYYKKMIKSFSKKDIFEKQVKILISNIAKTKIRPFLFNLEVLSSLHVQMFFKFAHTSQKN